MPFHPALRSLLLAQRFETHRQAAIAAREAAEYALRRRQENEAALKLTETRKRTGGWS